MELTDILNGNPGIVPTSALPQTLVSAVVNAFQNLTKDSTDSVDSLLLGKVASFTSLAGTGTQNFFSVYNGTTHTFTRNPGCIYSWPSWASCWNSANANGTGGNQGMVCMVTPTQGITNHHFAQIYATGVAHYFPDSDQPLVVSASQQIGTTDIQIVTFASAAPAVVGVASFLLGGTPGLILPSGTPVIATNQQKRAVVLEFYSDFNQNSNIQSATATNRVSWTLNPPAVTGDSDSFVVAVFSDGRSALLTTWHDGNANPSDGPTLSSYIGQINAALATGVALAILPLDYKAARLLALDGNNTLNLPASLTVTGTLSDASQETYAINPDGSFLFADGEVTGDANGNVAANSLVLNKGIGLFGHAAPTAQPAAAVTLSDVIAILKGAGLCGS